VLLALLVSFSRGGVGSDESADDSTHPDNSTHDDGHGDGHDDGHAEHAEHKYPHKVLLFLIVSLMAGAVLRFASIKLSLPIPYTVLLLVYGGIIGINLKSGRLDGERFELGESAYMSAGMDPHLLLFLFLPPLIFESAFSMDFHLFKKQALKCFILAGPGLVLSFIMIGICVKYMMYTDESWATCFLLGAILSATDPVAVVALLKELGASKKLGTLIEGESLLNDGTAIVVFLVLFDKVVDADLVLDPATIALQFIQMSIGGPIVGYILGCCFLWFIGKVFNDSTIEITATLCAAYLTFYLAEWTFKMSGVLAVVALGLTFANYGTTKISPEVAHFLHEFWGMVGYLCNTILFVITGVILATHDYEDSGRTVIWLLFLLFCITTVVRTLIMALCYPIFVRLEYSFSWSEVLVCSWGGLRGAVGLALALVVYLDVRISHSSRERVFFCTAGIVCSTLLINATTIKFLLSGLGMLKITAAKKQLLDRASEKLKDVLDDQSEILKQKSFYRQSKFELVKEYATVDLYEGVAFELEGRGVSDSKKIRVMEENMITEIRSTALKDMIVSFKMQYATGRLGKAAMRIMMHAAEDAADEIQSDADGVAIIKWGNFDSYLVLNNLLERAQELPVFGSIARRLIHEQLTLGVDITNGFLLACDKSLSELHDAFDLKHHKLLALVQRAHRAEIENAREALADMQSIFPEILCSISSRHTARILLNCERAAIMNLNKQGLLDDMSTERGVGLVEGKMKKLAEMPPWVPLPSKEQTLREIPWIRDLDADAFKLVHDNAIEQVFARDTTFISQGDVGHSVYVIARGVCDIETQSPHSHYANIPKKVQHMGMGGTIGDTTLLTGITQKSISVKAHTTVLGYQLHNHRMRELLSTQPVLLESLWRHSAVHLAWPVLMELPVYAHLDSEQLNDKARKWRLYKMQSSKGSGGEIWGEWAEGKQGSDILASGDEQTHATDERSAKLAGKCKRLLR
jgi:NhaP-type Na+/H+ or K+/H+ antiporter